MTSNPEQRAFQHRTGEIEGFTSKYRLRETMELAIVREMQLKKWYRIWKLALIEKQNPDRDDLWSRIAS